MQLLALDDLRRRRSSYLEEETGLSYLRRTVQGALDIVRSEISRRRAGTGSDLAGLVEDLPNLLAAGEGGSTGRLLQIEPTRVDPVLAGELEEVLERAPVEDVTQLGEAELAELAVQLEGFERKVSEARRALHGEIDALQAELTRRYRTGEASVETLLD